jgi:hypothetical protein
MTPASFKSSLAKSRPPANLSPALAALWWAGKDDWDKAHEIVMGEENDKDCAWVHAYLHRVEGDLSNARYWYRQATKPAASGALPAEWEAIAKILLAKGARAAR